MADIHSPNQEPARAPRRYVDIFRRPDWPDDEDVVMEETTVLQDTIATAEDNRLHLGAMLDILRKCNPDYPLPACVLVGNIETIHRRMAEVIVALRGIEKRA